MSLWYLWLSGGLTHKSIVVRSCSLAGLGDQLGLLLLYQSSCYITISLPQLFEFIYGLIIEFIRLVVLGDFNLPSLGMGLGIHWYHGSYGLIQVVQSSVKDNSHTPDLLFLSEHW